MPPEDDNRLARLRAKAAGLPDAPGVYLFKDAAGRVLYVGKAKSLRNRVRSYFLDSRPPDGKTDLLVRKTRDLDYLVLDNEMEALYRLGEAEIIDYNNRWAAGAFTSAMSTSTTPNTWKWWPKANTRTVLAKDTGRFSCIRLLNVPWNTGSRPLKPSCRKRMAKSSIP